MPLASHLKVETKLRFSESAVWLNANVVVELLVLSTLLIDTLEI